MQGTAKSTGLLEANPRAKVRSRILQAAAANPLQLAAGAVDKNIDGSHLEKMKASRTRIDRALSSLHGRPIAFGLFIVCALTCGCSRSSPAPEKTDQAANRPGLVKRHQHVFVSDEARGPAGSARVYRFGALPVHTSIRMSQIYQPLVDELNRDLDGDSMSFEPSLNYLAFQNKLQLNGLDFALVNPYQAVLAHRAGYVIFGKAADDDRFRGLLIVRRNSRISDLTDLKGKRLDFPAPTAMVTLMTRMFLREHGVDLDTETNVHYVNSHDSSIMGLVSGLADAAGSWPPAWEALTANRPDLTRLLEAKWATPALPNMALVARSDLPPDRVKEVARVFFGLHEKIHGRILLKEMQVSKFEPATTKSYDPVRRFINDYEAKFGSIAAAKAGP